MAYDLISRRTSARDWSCGSIVWPEKEQKKLFDKIDDVRYDVRNAKGVIGTGIFALAAGLTFIGLSSIYRASVETKGKRS